MLAVLILSALTAIAFSMAAIVFIEIRTSGDTLRTEPALYATLGITEETLMQNKTNFTPTSLGDLNMVAASPYSGCAPVSKNVCTLNNVTLQFPGTQPIQFDQSPLIQVVQPREKITLPMYTPQSFDKQYGRMVISIIPTETDEDLTITLTKTDLANVKTVVIDHVDIDDLSAPLVFTNFQSDAQYDLELYNCGTSSGPCTSDDALIASIDTYDVNSTTAKGLPFIGKKVFKILANYLGLSRSYIVKIPD